VLSVLMATLVLAAADTTPAPAASAATPIPAAAPKAKAKDSDTVCWTEQVTGSHYPHRICSTRAELEQRQRQDQEAVAQHGRSMPGGSFGKSGP
jgi:hypothetical protein